MNRVYTKEETELLQRYTKIKLNQVVFSMGDITTVNLLIYSETLGTSQHAGVDLDLRSRRGSGDGEDPFVIERLHQIAKLAQEVNEYRLEQMETQRDNRKLLQERGIIT